MVVATGNITTLINNRMANWKTALTSELEQNDITRGYFQGDSLSLLLL